MALSSVILVAGKRTTSSSRHNSSRALEKRGSSGTQSAFRFLDSVRIKGKRKASGAKKKKKGFVDVVEDDQMGDLIVVKEDNQEEEEGL